MTEPPVRLIDEPGADPAVKQALRSLSEQPSVYDAQAGLERLQGALKAGGGAPMVPGRWLLGGGLGGAASVALVLWLATRPPTAPVAAPVASASASEAPGASPEQPASSALVEPIEPAALPSVSAPAAVSAEVGAPPRPGAQVTRQQLLAEEVRHLGEVRRLLASDPLTAARQADEGHRRFRGGVLYPEREALAILALSRAGQASARPRAAAFLKQFPRSPLAEQIRALAPEPR